MPTPARRAAFEILLRVEKQSSFAADLLHGPLTAELSERDAALCTELVMGALRWQRTLDFVAQSLATGKWDRFDPEVRVALRLGLYQLRFLTRIPTHAAVDESVELVKDAGKSSAAPLVNAVLRKGGQSDLTSLRPPNMSDLEWSATETSHPAWLLDGWSRRWGAEPAMALARSNNQTPKTYLRLNTAPLDSAQITEQLLVEGIEIRPGKFLKTSIAVESGNVARTNAFRQGQVVIQDEASQMVPHLLDVRQGQRVLDLCAAPGNKTGLLAKWAAGQSKQKPGFVVACDIHLHRLRQFTPPPPRTQVYRAVLDGEKALPFAAVFDRVLVDAPCSGTGTLRRNPELKWRLRPADIAEMAATQLRLLEHAAQGLQPGGRMVYSTCSLELEENQAVIERFLSTHPEFRLLPVREDRARLGDFFHPAADRLLDAEYLETSPARDNLDGFFAAILVSS